MAKVRWSYAEAKKHAAAINIARGKRLRQVIQQAGLDPTIGCLHVHNAWVSYQQGRPWANVDYSLVRKARYLESHLFDSYRILDRYVCRRDLEDRFWIQADQGKFA